MLAAKNNHLKIVELLFKRKLNLNKLNQDGKTAYF